MADGAAPFEWLRVPEAARLLGVSVRRLYEMVGAGEVPHDTRPVRFDRDAPGKTTRMRLSLGPDVRSERAAKEAERALRTEMEREAAEEQRARASSIAAAASAANPDGFSRFADHWLSTHVRVKKKPTTWKHYEGVVRNWLKPYWKDTPITTITAADVDDYVAWATTHRTARTVAGEEVLDPPRAPKWINETIGVLSSLLSQAETWKRIPLNPCAKVEKLQTPPLDWDFYTREESDLFLATCLRLEPWWHPLFMTGFRTGMREGELFALRWGDVDFVAMRVHIKRSISAGLAMGEDGVAVRVEAETTPKSGKPRAVDMSPELAEVLRAHRHPGVRVFVRKDGRDVRRESILYPWERVTRASGLRAITPHDMRHSFASQLVMLGAPLAHVQDALGHSTIAMTQRYAHLAPGTVAPWVAMLDSTGKGAGKAVK